MWDPIWVFIAGYYLNKNIFAFYFRIVILCLIAVSKSIEEEYEYEDEAAPAPVTAAPTKPTSRLGGLLSPRNRSPAAKKTAQVNNYYLLLKVDS